MEKNIFKKGVCVCVYIYTHTYTYVCIYIYMYNWITLHTATISPTLGINYTSIKKNFLKMNNVLDLLQVR